MQMPGFDFTNVTINVIIQYKLLIMDQISSAVNNIVNTQDPRTFDNTVQPLINVTHHTEPYKNLFGYITNFYPDKELRTAAQEAEMEISKFIIDIMMRKDLYGAFLSYQNTLYKTEKSTLTNEENRYFEHEMRDFKRNGLHLNDIDYDNVKSMLKELSDLSIKFNDNINDVTTSFKFTKEELDGMPSYWFIDDKLNQDNDEITPSYKITLKYPDYIPAMEYVKNEKIRKQLYMAYNSRCSDMNTELLTKAIQLRYLVANKLGYDNYADYKTENQIIKTGQNALDFLSGLNEKFTPIYHKDMIKLLDFAINSSSNPLNKTDLDQWDLSYYSRELTEIECNIDMDEIRKYFPLDVVKNGLFTIYQTILGLKFTEVNTTNKWHDDVSLYVVNDAITDELLGYFYLDLHPRDGKFSHAAAFQFISGCDMTKISKENKRQHHVVTIACNFPKNGHLTHSDTKTFFHEFGHVMHQICSKPQLQSFTGFGVENDFVEVMSQALERWTYTEEALSLMSKHSETGESMPKSLINKLDKKKNFLSGITNKRQLLFGLADLKMHSLTNFEKLNLQDLWYETVKEVTGQDHNPRLHLFASFGHLMSEGYTAGYYGYLLSDTYAANIFYKLFADGHVMDPEIGKLYRKKLLEPGATNDGLVLLKDLLGENPNNDYFLKEKGLLLN